MQIGCRNREPHAIEVLGLEFRADVLDPTLGRQLGELIANFRGDDSDLRTGTTQQCDLACCDVTAADD